MWEEMSHRKNTYDTEEAFKRKKRKKETMGKSEVEVYLVEVRMQAMTNLIF